MKLAVVTSYGKKGEEVVNMNHTAIDKGVEALVKVDVPDSWKNVIDEKKENISVPDFVRNICMPMYDLKGDNLPVSAFIDNKMEDGTFMHGTTKYEKRGIAVNVINVHMYVLMHVLDHFYQQKMNCKMHQNHLKK